MHESLNPGRARGLEQAPRAVHVDRPVAGVIAPGHVVRCGQVVHHIASGGYAGVEFGREIALDQFHLGRQERFATAAGADQCPDRDAIAQQPMDQTRANEPCGAGDERTLFRLLLLHTNSEKEQQLLWTGLSGPSVRRVTVSVAS